jgi:hypothetical protein
MDGASAGGVICTLGGSLLMQNGAVFAPVIPATASYSWNSSGREARWGNYCFMHLAFKRDLIPYVLMVNGLPARTPGRVQAEKPVKTSLAVRKYPDSGIFQWFPGVHGICPVRCPDPALFVSLILCSRFAHSAQPLSRLNINVHALISGLMAAARELR